MSAASRGNTIQSIEKEIREIEMVDPQMWQVLALWFYSYTHNKSLEREKFIFYRIYKVNVQNASNTQIPVFGGQTRLKIL